MQLFRSQLFVCKPRFCGKQVTAIMKERYVFMLHTLCPQRTQIKEQFCTTDSDPIHDARIHMSSATSFQKVMLQGLRKHSTQSKPLHQNFLKIWAEDNTDKARSGKCATERGRSRNRSCTRLSFWLPFTAISFTIQSQIWCQNVLWQCGTSL